MPPAAQIGVGVLLWREGAVLVGMRCVITVNSAVHLFVLLKLHG